MQRAIIIVLDSVGVGELPDAGQYGDKWCNTLANIADCVGGLSLPNLESLGLGKITEITGLSGEIAPKAFYGKMAEKSKAKDTITGHWEIAGVVVDTPFPTYPDGFPPEIIDEFRRRTNLDIIGNRAASGTQIIEEYGEEHIKTGFPIVYTSVDSVFQIAACEEVVSVEALYDLCATARDILCGEHNVGRVIARPFTRAGGKFARTERRKDFSVLPPYPTLLDLAVENNLEVVGIGKIGDIFAHRGLTEEIHTSCNRDGVNQTIECMKRAFSGIIFTNLVDFDMQYGHRNDIIGYADALALFDDMLPGILRSLGAGDTLIITADHGCDPTVTGTDHTREYAPILVYSAGFKKQGSLGERESFADVGATVAECLSLPPLKNGKSFWSELV